MLATKRQAILEKKGGIFRPKWKRERETERQRQRQTDRQTERQTDRQTDRQTEAHWQTEKQTDRDQVITFVLNAVRSTAKVVSERNTNRQFTSTRHFCCPPHASLCSKRTEKNAVE